eukprot:165372-Rhodomonas_salina.1
MRWTYIESLNISPIKVPPHARPSTDQVPPAMPYAVLTNYAAVLCNARYLPAVCCYQVLVSFSASGTNITAMPLRLWYAMTGTEIGYAATR